MHRESVAYTDGYQVSETTSVRAKLYKVYDDDMRASYWEAQIITETITDGATFISREEASEWVGNQVPELLRQQQLDRRKDSR